MTEHSCIQIQIEIGIGIEFAAPSAATQTVTLDCPVRSACAALQVRGRAMTT